METSHIEELLKRCGLRPTSNRVLIYRELAMAKHPVSLGDLEDILYPADKSSIFRTLTNFVDHSIVHALEDGSGSTKYEVCMKPGQCEPEDHHVHFHCEVCQRTFCIETQKVPKITLPSGFVAESVNFTVKGVCSDCGNKNSETK